jgi:ATP-binding cassette subfamily B protein
MDKNRDKKREKAQDGIKQDKAQGGMRRLLQLAMTKKTLMICAVILATLSSLASFIPYLATYMVMREILGAWPDIAALDVQRAISFGWLAFGGVAANIVTYFAALACSHYAAFGTLYELKVSFIHHLAKVPLGFHIMAGSGKLRKIMSDTIESIEGFIAHQLPDIVAAIVAPIALFVILFAVDWRFGLASFVGIIISVLVYFRGMKKSSVLRVSSGYQAALSKMSNATVEFIRGISVIKAFHQTANSFKRLNETIAEYTELAIPFALSLEKPTSLFNTLINHVYLLVAVVGVVAGMSAADHLAFASTFIFYLVFVPSVAGILMKMIYAVGGSARIMTGVTEMDEVLAVPPLPQPPSGKTASSRVTHSCDVVFRDVTFFYGDSKTPALKDVSFTARQNQMTAIVGPSGGGKSTIAHLIPRFFDVAEGAVSIGGTDVRDMTTDYLMEQVSFVFQDVFLFKQSIKGNIRMGNPKATDEQITDAAKAAQCHEFITRLPQGYDTVIGAKGVHLSGGEQQRLSIARAIIKDAPVLVLDEATAFADPENEHLIQKALQKLIQGKTVIVIAHRLPTVRGADKIIVMDEGRLCEAGAHEELVAKGGRYTGLWQAYDKSASWRMERAV